MMLNNPIQRLNHVPVYEQAIAKVMHIHARVNLHLSLLHNQLNLQVMRRLYSRLLELDELLTQAVHLSLRGLLLLDPLLQEQHHLAQIQPHDLQLILQPDLVAPFVKFINVEMLSLLFKTLFNI